MSEQTKVVIAQRLSEFCREVGVLWLVFSILDRLVAQTLTVVWLGTNLLIGVALWVVGIYIELRTT